VETKGEEKWSHERKVQNGMPMFSHMSFVSGFCFFFFRFLFSFFNWLVGRRELGFCGLPGIVGLVVYAWMSS